MATLKPPFTAHTAHLKVKAAQALWNTRNPTLIVSAYTPDSIWRNRSTFLHGSAEISAFLTAKWAREKDYVLRKELFAFGEDKIAVQFWYEYRDAEDGMRWKRCYGLEDWTFDGEGRMRKRMMSGNDVRIEEGERWFGGGVEGVDGVEIGEEHWAVWHGLLFRSHEEALMNRLAGGVVPTLEYDILKRLATKDDEVAAMTIEYEVIKGKAPYEIRMRMERKGWR